MILVGDNRERLRELGDATIDAVVTDPPYELGFMSKAWDATGIAYSVELWREVLRVLKPGGHLLAFGGSRTYHRLACAVEDAGFEIRDMIEWVYGSGFPKSLDVSKAIDKMHGAEREVVGYRSDGATRIYDNGDGPRMPEEFPITKPTSDDAKRWSGWGTALKPAHEPIVLARKPLDGTVAETVLAHGTGALNIDGCRVEMSHEDNTAARVPMRSLKSGIVDAGRGGHTRNGDIFEPAHGGRFPANFIHDGSDEVLELFPETTSQRHARKRGKPGVCDLQLNEGGEMAGHNDSGSAARFFYCAKASRAEREAGLAHMPLTQAGSMSGGEETRPDRPTNHPYRQNHHPTVKPVALMRYLVRLVTPPGGVVLDPFTGSGTTGIAARLEGCEFLGIELSPDYAAIAEARIAHAA